MKKHVFLFILISLFFEVHAQIRYEKGYIIKNDDKRVDCLIKNLDWKNNPKKIEYKITEDSESISADINSIREFSINDNTYRRFKVHMDRSSDVLRSLTSTKNPIFSEEVLFLKVLEEGDADLYVYEDENLRRYFYQINNSEVEQLINKSYLTKDNKVERNEAYKQQLWLNLKCDKISIKTLEKIAYNGKDLKNLFQKFNYCISEPPVVKEDSNNKTKKNLYHIAIRPGINFSTMTLRRFQPYGFADFGSKITYRLGIENEFTLPFHKNKWSIIVEPTYQYYTSNSELVRLYSPEKEGVNVEYKSIELPLGIRHFFFLSKNSKIYVNSQFVYDITYNSRFKFESSGPSRPDLHISKDGFENSYNFVFGLGFKSRQISLETRYNLTRNVLNGHGNWSSKYKALSFVFGYNIF